MTAVRPRCPVCNRAVRRRGWRCCSAGCRGLLLGVTKLCRAGRPWAAGQWLAAVGGVPAHRANTVALAEYVRAVGNAAAAALKAATGTPAGRHGFCRDRADRIAVGLVRPDKGDAAALLAGVVPAVAAGRVAPDRAAALVRGCETAAGILEFELAGRVEA